MNSFKFFPETASTIASEIDMLYFIFIAISVFFMTLICGSILYFIIRYRRRTPNEVGKPVVANKYMEMVWIAVPTVIGVTMFYLGAKPFLKVREIPEDAIEIAVVGKRWMWKFQHPDGRREINELHIPKDRPVHLKMISQDVIHSFYVPAFRIKQDALPMYYTSIWFEPTKVGEYHIFCTEYCGKDHSIMKGKVYVIPSQDYEQWLQSDPAEMAYKDVNNNYMAKVPLPKDANRVVKAGHSLFHEYKCVSCHQGEKTHTGPNMANLYGREVKLENGRKVKADDNYLRESILNPQAKITQGYNPLMPSFKGRVSEEDLIAIIAYIKALRSQG